MSTAANSAYAAGSVRAASLPGDRGAQHGKGADDPRAWERAMEEALGAAWFGSLPAAARGASPSAAAAHAREATPQRASLVGGGGRGPAGSGGGVAGGGVGGGTLGGMVGVRASGGVGGTGHSSMVNAGEDDPRGSDRQPGGTGEGCETGQLDRSVSETGPLDRSVRETRPLGRSVSETTPLDRSVSETRPLDQSISVRPGWRPELTTRLRADLSVVAATRHALDATPYGSWALATVGAPSLEASAEGCTIDEQTGSPGSFSPAHGAAASTEAREPMRWHAEWTPDGLRLWFGLDSIPGFDWPRLTQLVVQELRLWLGARGVRLQSVISNGETLWTDPTGSEETSSPSAPQPPYPFIREENP